jgi:D-glycero-alpha-D-manno-heptose-7-phosphate kinase
MSFVGGGSDLPAFYCKHQGAVVSTAIDKYVYVNVNKKFDNGVRVGYSKNEEVQSVSEVEHQLVRAAMTMLKIDGGIEITTIADIPSKGSGLGSSSSFTVGLLHALNAYQHRYVSAEKLASDACRVEIEMCGEPIGKQDQWAAALGGFNLIQFNPDGSVISEPIICSNETLSKLQENLIMFYTGITRSASFLLQEQSEILERDQDKQKTLLKMVKLAYDMRDELHANNIEAIGDVLHENWMLKKSISSSITNSDIDVAYDLAIKAGATGGKILGAGAGGFLLFYAPLENHDRIKMALPHLRHINFSFEKLGSRIIFYN